MSTATSLTFNVRFPDSAYDETPAARTVRFRRDRVRSTRLSRWTGRAGSWECDHTGLMRTVGQPFADTSLFAG